MMLEDRCLQDWIITIRILRTKMQKEEELQTISNAARTIPETRRNTT